MDRIDHDRLFKELLSTFFFEFIDLFLPQVSAYLDRDSIEFLDKEIFTDVTSGDKHEVDLAARARFRGQDTFFIIHVETQSTAEADFNLRMFDYFSRLHRKFGLKVYPIVLFSYDAPRRAEPTWYKVAFPDLVVLQFHYRVIQLNRLSWRKFVNQPNPVASALMAKMRIAPRDRPKAKLECLRLLGTLKLNPAKARLISGFVDSYLQLNTAEQKQYDRQLAAIQPPQQESIMELMTSWKREGIEQGRQEGLQQGKQEGRQEGKEEILARQIRWRFGTVSSEVQERLHRLSATQLDSLGEAMFGFTSLTDLETWLSAQAAS